MLLILILYELWEEKGREEWLMEEGKKGREGYESDEDREKEKKK